MTVTLLSATLVAFLVAMIVTRVDGKIQVSIL
jgi:hypothetical protein